VTSMQSQSMPDRHPKRRTGRKIPVPATRASFIHPAAVLGRNVVLGSGVVIEAQAVVEDEVVLDDEVTIGAGAFVGRGCHIGHGSSLRAGVAVYHRTVIGRGVTIESGVVIGADGFGYAPGDKGPYKIPQVGIVIVQDGAYIGAGSCVDRAALGKTIIGEDVRIGRQVQIGHNVQIGAGTTIGDQSGICGSTKIGCNCRLGRRVGVTGHLVIEDDVVVEDYTGISKNVSRGAHMVGFPATDPRSEDLRQGLLDRLPVLYKQVQGLENRVK
jgi:UDP-3-O-[3-hydroxymyristoyl] glucosamine N-acyltransferase